MTTTDVSLLAYVKSLFPFNTDRIQSISREDGKLFVASVNMGEYQTLFYISPETKEPVYRNKTTYETEKEAMVINVQDKTILTDEDKRKLKIKHNIR